MATRAEVENAIETIENNGNNTAKEVRDVLTMLLDYTENDEASSEHVHFRYKGRKLLDRRGAHFWYSLDGFKGYSVNFTLKILIWEANLSDPIFTLDPEVYKTLREIIKTDDLCFSVSVRQRSQDQVRHMALYISLEKENHILFKFMGSTNTKKDDIIFTSIHLHAPEKFGLEEVIQ